MALSAEQTERITRGMVDLYRAAEWSILEILTEALGKGLDGPDWMTQRLAALPAVRARVERVLSLADGTGGTRILRVLADAYAAGRVVATAGLPAGLLPAAPEVADNIPRVRVLEVLARAWVADSAPRHSAVLRTVVDAYRQVVQQATAASVAGGITRRQAAQYAYARLVDQGLTSFVDRRGRRWRLSSYVEMGVRTVTQRAAIQGQTDRLQELDLDLAMVSDSPRECEKCRPWEGKILSISGAARGRVELPSMTGGGTVSVTVAGSLDEARRAGLQHPGCTHSIRAYLPGATRRVRPHANPGGYEAKQRQREIERQIRHWKERQGSALDPTAAAAAGRKVAEWQGVMRSHLTDHPELKRLRYRESPGAGNLPPAARQGRAA